MAMNDNSSNQEGFQVMGNGGFYFVTDEKGEIIAICQTRAKAEAVADALNTIESQEDIIVSVEEEKQESPTAQIHQGFPVEDHTEQAFQQQTQPTKIPVGTPISPKKKFIIRKPL